MKKCNRCQREFPANKSQCPRCEEEDQASQQRRSAEAAASITPDFTSSYNSGSSYSSSDSSSSGSDWSGGGGDFSGGGASGSWD